MTVIIEAVELTLIACILTGIVFIAGSAALDINADQALSFGTIPVQNEILETVVEVNGSQG